MAAINWEMSNIIYNLMHEFEIDHSFEGTIKKLVEQHWPRRGVIYRYICNIVAGSSIIDETPDYYIVRWNIEQCQSLMNTVITNTLCTRIRSFKDVQGNTIFQVKVYK